MTSLSPTPPAPDPTLAPTPVVDADHPRVVEFAESRAAGATDPRERAVRLYHAVRDEIRYDPYAPASTVATIRASATLETRRAWCVPKAVLLAAACRALGIPARLGFADVRNHLSTARMRERMQTEIFYWHGYTSILVADGGTRWVKATPAFNLELCDKFGFLPLEFDGEADSLYHPFDREGHRHMEYVHERGEFDDLPLDAMQATFAEKYPNMAFDVRDEGADFDRDVELETREA